ncbi:hypothetical protein LCGC14_2938230, partial [marine sediment metagenome]
MVTAIAISVLTKLAGFSAKRPKVMIGIVAVLILAGFGIHYKMLVGERDKLRVAQVGYELAVDTFRAREATLKEDLRISDEAAAIAVAERTEARRTLDVFMAGREDDPESMEWAQQAIPIGQLER